MARQRRQSGHTVSPLTGATTSFRLDATAAESVFVSHLAGDLLVGTVTGAAGDVSLEAVGSLYNAHTWTVNPSRQAEIDQNLDELGMLDTVAAVAKAVENLQTSVRSQYMRYWGLRNDGVVFNGRLQLRAEAYDTWATSYGDSTWPARRYGPHIAAGARSCREPLLIPQRTSLLAPSVVIGRQWLRSPRLMADWVYTPTQVQVDQLKADLGLDAISLLGSIGTDIGEAMRPWDPAVRVGGAVNVTGATVTLVSQAGTVGRTAEPVTILADDILEDRLTDAQLFELQLAGQRGDAVPVTDGFQLNALRPLVTAASHRVDASGPAGVAVAQSTGTLPIGSIMASQGTVDLAADGDIVNAEWRHRHHNEIAHWFAFNSCCDGHTLLAIWFNRYGRLTSRSDWRRSDCGCAYSCR